MLKLILCIIPLIAIVAYIIYTEKKDKLNEHIIQCRKNEISGLKAELNKVNGFLSEKAEACKQLAFELNGVNKELSDYKEALKKSQQSEIDRDAKVGTD